MCRSLIWCGVACFSLAATLRAQQSDQEVIKQLTLRLAESERRIQALEQKLGMLSTASGDKTGSASSSVSASQAGQASENRTPEMPASDANAKPITKSTQALADAHAEEMQGHNMQIPGGGPTLNIRGFFDFNFGAGSIANPLIFPIASNGCMTCGNPPTPGHSAFQAGEFDLFMTSRLSDHLSFLAEMVFGADTTNEFSIDMERYQLAYHLNDYFSVSAGRFHTAIGYYNTAYHHGNWFSTAEGRPIMYLFEDSGGILPVHTVGVTMTGLVPQTGNLGLHWIAEIGNGRSSNPVGEPVQNFYSDRSYKAFNLAAYIKPEQLHGLQIGGSYYHDRLVPTGFPRVSQDIASGYVVYLTPAWEFFNEAVLLSNHLAGTPITFNSPMAYTQLSRKFGLYRPYFRYQYVNARVGDPVNILQGLFYGPSVGVRMDYSEYAAFKLQYNRLWTHNPATANGLNAQIAFTF
jgi:hypothetical protein